MIKLFVIDYYQLYKTNGMATYLNQLEKYKIRNKEIQLNYVWVNSKPQIGFKQENIYPIIFLQLHNF